MLMLEEMIRPRHRFSWVATVLLLGCVLYFCPAAAMAVEADAHQCCERPEQPQTATVDSCPNEWFTGKAHFDLTFAMAEAPLGFPSLSAPARTEPAAAESALDPPLHIRIRVLRL
jgi:hypothetical protein